MQINCPESLQTATGKNYNLTWTDRFSSFRFSSSGQEYLARNYAFSIVEGDQVVRFTVAIDEVGIQELEKMVQRKITEDERLGMAKHHIRETIDFGHTLPKNNLAEVKSDVFIRIAHTMGMM